jgi:assimilatory nitrate reductase catalytic subunit
VKLRAFDGPLTAQLARTRAAGDLGQVPARLNPDATTDLVCGFCSTGCGLTAHLKDGVAVNLSPSPNYPVNRGAACPKGWDALRPTAALDRATTPMIRGSRGKLVPTTWHQALATFVGRMRAVQAAHGPESVAFLSTGQITTEEMALLGALAKFGMGMVHGDGNTRQCMATAVSAYKESFGFDAPPYTYADLEASDVVVLWGSNLAVAHPILWERLWRNRNRPALIVVDPRRTETAMAATQHLAPRPKSDLVLLYGLARLLIERGLIDRPFIDAHTDDFEDYAAHVAPYTLDRVCEATGLTAEAITTLAETIGRGERVSLWWTMGVNQSHEGVLTAEALIALSLMTGQIGRPGTGPNSVTGQCNAMGSRLFSNTSSLFGGRDFSSAADRNEVAGVLGIDPALIPDNVGLAYDRILEGVSAGRIKALWIIGTNPAHSWIHRRLADDVFDQLDFLVVQDMYETSHTAQRAHLLLPAAGWGEKEGTFINSERRVGLLKRVLRAPGQALTDFAIFRLVAEAWGVGEMFARWDSPEAVFHILRELSRGRPCDITGIADYHALDAARGVQWPCPEGAALEPGAERRLFADGQFPTPNGRARFCKGEPAALPEPPCAEYPLLLLTGRGSASQWHTGTRTDKSGVLAHLHPSEIYVELHPDDARPLGIRPHEPVRVESRRGALTARAVLTYKGRQGEAFVPMHYEATNRLCYPAFDPTSRQPAYKAAAIRVRRLERWEDA